MNSNGSVMPLHRLSFAVVIKSVSTWLLSEEPHYKVSGVKYFSKGILKWKSK
jgi:hypothetical protein